MASSDEEDMIDAFFKGKIIRNVDSVKPNFNISKIDVKFEENEKENKYERKFEKVEDNVIERKILTDFLNAPIEKIDDTLGIEESDEREYFDPETEKVYQKYEFEIPSTKLPILQKRDELLSTIRRNKVVVLKADTGCGKSSQVPQYILEDCVRRNVQCNIIVTQPKKISAESLAQRVAFERKCEVGSLVGYQIGLDKRMDDSDTRILYCTTGVFLQKLVYYKSLEKWTHIIIDEIHERDLDMDMVLLIIRRLMVATKSKAKIILMSATLNCDKIAKYFTIVQNIPIIDLNIKKPFPIKIHYLDEFDHLGANKEDVDLNEPLISKNMLRLGVDLIEFFMQKGAESFLVFLPGIFEIESFQREFKMKSDSNKKFHIFILHSSIPLTNMKGLYDTNLKNKLVLATNIAESSITIPNIRIILDYCLTKYLVVDSASSLTQLKLSWASKMNMEQRAGRTGRTSIGQVVRMLFKDQYESLPDEGKAEMQRTSLETVVLKSKKLNMGRPSDILAIALDPPDRNAIVDAILLLKESGALTRFSKNAHEFDFLDGNLTLTGDMMSKLPIDIRLSKLIILGHVFSVLNECIIIAAGLSVGSIFKHDNSMNAFETRLSHDSTSDLIAVLNAYIKYNEFVKNNQNDINKSLEERWCNNQMINYKSIKEMTKQIEDIRNRLKQFNMLTDNFRYTTEDKMFALKICIAGAFYPNYYSFGGEAPGREEFKHVYNKNLCSSVYFQTKRSTKNGHLYEKQFRELLFDAEITDSADDASITFDNSSQKIFVQFNNMRNDCTVKLPGEVKLDVYRALKFRSLKRSNDLKIFIMTPENEEIYAPFEERQSIYNQDHVSSELKLKAKFNIFPSFSLKTEEKDQFLFGHVTYIISPSKFFYQPRKAIKLMEKLKKAIGSNLQKITDIDERLQNDRIMVLHENEFKRAQIMDFPQDNNDSYKVLLIDFGPIIECKMDDFYTACARERHERQDIIQEFFKMPPMCYECKLAEIQPTATQQYGWNKKAIEKFIEAVSGRIVQLKLYAFNAFDKIAAVHLYTRNSERAPIFSVNFWLVEKGLASKANESYIFMSSKTSTDNFESLKYAVHREATLCEFPEKLLNVKCELLGPFSPLTDTGRLRKISRAEERDISVDHMSVNAELFDFYPYDGVRKLLVASAKSKTSRGRITLQQTTVMPALKGLSSILALIFSPIGEIRHDEEMTRYTSILTGLGCDFRGKPYYTEHDCLIRTDVEIDNEDIKWINELRTEMSFLMQRKSEEKFEYQQNPMNALLKARNRACSILLKIVKKERLQLGENYKDPFDWTIFTKKEAIEYQKMFPSHNFVKLCNVPQETIRFLTHHLKDLDQKARYNTRDERLDCMVCDERIETLTDLKNHVLKIKHCGLKDKFENLEREQGSSSKYNR